MRLYYGGYGHHPSGKQYVYWGSDNYRVGQNVVAPVTHYKSGKTYNTMFTIQRALADYDRVAYAETQRLEGNGIDIKSIGGANVMTLPGARQFQSKQAWAEHSNEVYHEQIRQRLLTSNESPNTNEQAKARLLRR